MNVYRNEKKESPIENLNELIFTDWLVRNGDRFW